MNSNIIKFGGSVITDKKCKGFFNEKNTYRLAKELYPHSRGCILIHGTGLVGKPPAIKHGYLEDGVIPKGKSLLALNIRSELRQLNQLVVKTLLSVSIPVIPFDTSHYFNESMNSLRHKDLQHSLTHTIENGFVPTFYGDLMPRSNGSFKVFSSDTIALILARTLKPDKVLFLSSVKGVYPHQSDRSKNREGEVLAILNDDNLNSIYKSSSDEKDVSGGMMRKATCALEVSRYCKKCFIASGLDSGVLSKLLKGESSIGTLVTTTK
jgi:isopentenyl phosphate kinase